MRAITVTSDHRLQISEIPEPEPGDGEVLVDVVAAGVNRADVAQAAGAYPPPPGASSILGLEVSGRRRDTGEPVVALLAGGGYAEVVAVPESHMLPVPEGVDLVDAAGLIEVAATVVSNIVMEAGLPVDGSAKGQTVLVHGGTGGIGSFAIPFLHQLSARVLTTVGSDAAVETVRDHGADMAWNRRTTDIPAVVRDAGGADIILDVVGGPALGDNIGMLREFGRLVVIGTLGGAVGEVNLGMLMSRRARIIATTLRSRGVEDKARIVRRTHELVWPLVASGAISVPVHERMPLADAERAHEILRTGGHHGKVVLEVA